MMKKFLSILLLSSTLLVACSNRSNQQSQSNSQTVNSSISSHTSENTSKQTTTRTAVVFENLENNLDARAQEVVDTLAYRMNMMVERNTEELDRLLDDRIELTHITGRIQTKQDYLEQIADGRMAYHEMTIIDPVVTFEGDTATIEYTSLVNVTISGSNGTWRMRNHNGLEKRDGVWVWTTSPRPVLE